MFIMFNVTKHINVRDNDEHRCPVMMLRNSIYILVLFLSVSLSVSLFSQVYAYPYFIIILHQPFYPIFFAKNK
jgi:hypothetical protein